MIPIDRAVNRSTAHPAKTNGQADRTAEYVLYDLVRTHAEREGEALATYQRTAEQFEDEGIRYLMRLIMEDEARHHRQISEMLNELHSFVSELDIKPRMPNLRVRHNAALREETERLLAFEREDARELQRLRKELRANSGYSFFALLVDLMLHDTAKHIAILRFIH